MTAWRSRITATLLALAFWRGPEAAAETRMPRIGHIVVVIEENQGYSKIVAQNLPFIRGLMADGATFTRAFGVAHPSQPNYLALFSGSTWNIRDDADHDLHGPNLATVLREAGLSFTGFVESGSPRKHNPWESFANAAGVEASLAAFPRDFSRLPTVAFVVPNERNDMHSGSPSRADHWLAANIAALADWCRSNDGLLILTFDEDDNHADNQVLTIFYGSAVQPGRYEQRIDHYTVLRTIAALTGTSPLGMSAEREPITAIWKGE